MQVLLVAVLLVAMVVEVVVVALVLLQPVLAQCYCEHMEVVAEQVQVLLVMAVVVAVAHLQREITQRRRLAQPVEDHLVQLLAR